jgi:hypothetical protein
MKTMKKAMEKTKIHRKTQRGEINKRRGNNLKTG